MHNKKRKLQWLGKENKEKSHVIQYKILLFFRANNARSKSHSAEIYAKQARGDSIEARVSARAAAPDFRQPGNYPKKKSTETFSSIFFLRRRKTTTIHLIRYRSTS
jgi:hypothetical protein